MLLSYPNLQGRYDELVAAPGRPREPCSKLYTELTLASVKDIGAMRAAAERQIRDSGVTYNVYADPKGQDRPWDLDVLPLILDAQEWAQIESGITQRAGLLNAILGDIYGPQQLLREGIIPAPLIYGHSSFLRPACKAAVPGKTHLHVYAADLARSPDGRWWVIADRTQAEPPKGVYTFVAQCGISGVILGPPNHHDYQNKLRELHESRFSRMPFEMFKSRVRIVREEAVVKQWVEDQSWRTE